MLVAGAVAVMSALSAVLAWLNLRSAAGVASSGHAVATDPPTSSDSADLSDDALREALERVAHVFARSAGADELHRIFTSTRSLVDHVQLEAKLVDVGEALSKTAFHLKAFEAVHDQLRTRLDFDWLPKLHEPASWNLVLLSDKAHRDASILQVFETDGTFREFKNLSDDAIERLLRKEVARAQKKMGASAKGTGSQGTPAGTKTTD
jgi:hypothetical protein